MYDHLKPVLRDFSPGLFIIHVTTNNLPLTKTNNEIAKKIVNLAESVQKILEDKILEEICGKKVIPLIQNNNINSKRH